MAGKEDQVIEIIKKFEVVNKQVMQMTRRLSEMKYEAESLKRKINSFSDNR